MTEMKRIPGCKGRLVIKAENAAPADEYLLILDMTSFTWDRSAENSNFKVLADCSEQSGEGTKKYTIAGELMYALQDAGQGLIKEGQLSQWRFYPAFGDSVTDYVEGKVRWSSLSLSVTPDENQAMSVAGDGDGEYVIAGDVW